MGRGTIQFVIGPAGSGKSTYCHALQEHCLSLGPQLRRKVHVINLDPAAEELKYDVALDIRDLIRVDEVMEELQLGPNGGLVYCMEYLLSNVDWLHDELQDLFDDDDYILMDCPGQIELYTHVPLMRQLIQQMNNWGYTLLTVFVVDATFLCDASKFISGSLLSLSTMVSLELPNLNVVSKCDLVAKEAVEKVLDIESATLLFQAEQYNTTNEFHPKVSESAASNVLDPESEEDIDEDKELWRTIERRSKQRHRLTEAICSLLDDFHMVSFIPLDITDEDSLNDVLAYADAAVNYGEDTEVRIMDFTGDDTEKDD
jgi:GTPase SAR1 family protein